VTILGRGDLSPPRRYGRRRGRWRFLLVIVLIAAAAVGGWYAWKHFRDDDASVSTASTPCVTPSHPPAPAELKTVRVQVLNGTKRVGLAHRVAQQLKHRGAKVGRIGNTTKKVTVTVITHPSDQTAAAIAVREQLAAPAKLVVAKGAVALRIGPDFKGLASPADVTAAHKRDVAAANPSPPACASS
jgi:hypothetical protein